MKNKEKLQKLLELQQCPGRMAGHGDRISMRQKGCSMRVHKHTLFIFICFCCKSHTHHYTSIADTWQESWEPSATLGTWKCLGNTRRTYHQNIIQILYTIEIRPPTNAPDLYSKIQTSTLTSHREKELNFWSSSRSCYSCCSVVGLCPSRLSTGYGAASMSGSLGGLLMPWKIHIII